MLLPEMKSAIKYAIELDIDYLETFMGYEGDNVLKITARNAETIELLGKYLDNLGLFYKAEYNRETKKHNLFVGVEDSSVFKLKK